MQDDLLQTTTPSTEGETKPKRERSRKKLIRCENIRNACFFDMKGQKIKPGECAEVPAKVAKYLVDEAKVAVYVEAGNVH